MRELLGGHLLAGGILPFALEHVRDLLKYEGPLLSEFKNKQGDPFIFCLCEEDDLYSRWLVVRAVRKELVRYEAGIRSLRQLLRECPEQWAFICDIDAEGFTKRTRHVPIADVPDAYFPPTDSFGVVGEGGGQQSLLLDGRNGYEIVSHTPRQYLQPYAFAAVFGPHGDAEALGVLNHKFDHNCGWVFHNVFERRLLSGNHGVRASVGRMEFSSPGFVTFDVNSAVADDLRRIVKRYINGGRGLRRTVTDLKRWSNSKDRDKNRAEGKRLFASVCEDLDVNKTSLRKHTNRLVDAAKLLTAFVTRVHTLAVHHVWETATIVGLELDESKRVVFLHAVRKRKPVVVPEEIENVFDDEESDEDEAEESDDQFAEAFDSAVEDTGEVPVAEPDEADEEESFIESEDDDDDE